AYGPGRWGRLMSFLFVWQTFVQAPLSVASASIGFARYAGYLHPLTTVESKMISGGLVLLLVVLLYRKITTIGKISILLWMRVVGTMLWLIWGGIRHFDPKLAFDFPPGAFHLSSLWFGIGRGDGQYGLQLLGLLQHLPSRGRDSRAGEEYPERHFSFDSGDHGFVSGDANESAGRGSMEAGGEHAVHR